MRIGTGHWLATDGGLQPARGTHRTGAAVELTVRSGQRLVGEPGLCVLIARSRQLRWVRLDQVEDGDFAVLRYGGVWPAESPSLDDFVAVPPYGSQKRIELPTTMTSDLAFFLGAYVAEGHLNRSNWTVVVTNAVPEVLERVASSAEASFGLRPRIVYPPERCSYVALSSKSLCEYLDHLGCGASSHEKRIPPWVMQSEWRHAGAFLEGLWLDAFTAWMGKTPKWGIGVASSGLLDDVQTLLSHRGIVHGRSKKRDEATGLEYGEVYAVGKQAQALLRLVPFPEPDKRRRAEERLLAAPAQSTADVVPIIDPVELDSLIPRAPRGQRRRTQFAFLRDRRTKHVSRRTLERVAALPGVQLPELWRAVLHEDWHFSPINVRRSVPETALVDLDNDEDVAAVGPFLLTERAATPIASLLRARATAH